MRAALTKANDSAGLRAKVGPAVFGCANLIETSCCRHPGELRPSTSDGYAEAGGPIQIRRLAVPNTIVGRTANAGRESVYGVDDGGTRRLVACSNANASASSRGSLHAVPVNPTPNGAGFAWKLSGNAGVGAFGISPKGTTTIG